MSVKSFSENVAGSIERESKSIIASDIEIKGSWPLTREERNIVKEIAGEQALIQTVIELKAMTLIDAAEERPASSMLVELKAVPGNYPFYGKILVSPDTPFQELLQENNALVEGNFLLKSGLKIGGFFLLGESRLRISGTIKHEPDRGISFFNLGPRVMISSKTLDKTGLIRKGSRVRYKTRIKIPDDIVAEHLVKKIKKGLADTGMSIESHRQARPALRESIKRFESFLGSIGVIALLVGGIGVAMITRTFLELKIINVAILKSLGAQTYQIFSIYLIQALFLGLMGSLLGITGGFFLQWLVPAGVSKYFNVPISPRWLWTPALVALTLGMVTSFIFSLGPLLKTRSIPPARLLRRDIKERGPSFLTELEGGKIKRLFKLCNFNVFKSDQCLAIAVLGVGLLVITFWQAGSFKNGAIFFSGVVGAAGILIFISRGIIKVLKILPKPKSIAGRYGLSNLYRPHSQATPVIVALGVGVMLVLTVHLIQSDLLDYIHDNTPDNAPDFFFIDIQPDQVQRFKNIFKTKSEARLTDLTPIIRSRLYAVGSKPISEMTFDNARTKRFFNREYVLTYTNTLPEENTIIEGVWWEKTVEKFPRVSIEADAAETLGVSLGSQLTLNIQGDLLTATVTSLRQVNWNNRRTNFFMILSPESLDGLYYNFIATARVPEKDELELQTALVKTLPNVTAINTRNILVSVREVLDRLAFFVRALSLFTIATGLIILSGAIASTKFRRAMEVAVLKTIGATKGIIAVILSVEYLLLGMIAGGVGSFLSVLFSYGIGKYLIKLDWSFRPFPIIIGMVTTTLLVWLVGLMSSWDIINNRPLQTLRHETQNLV